MTRPLTVDVTTTIGYGWGAVASVHSGLDLAGCAEVFDCYVYECLGGHPGTDWGTAPLALDVSEQRGNIRSSSNRPGTVEAARGLATEG